MKKLILPFLLVLLLSTCKDQNNIEQTPDGIEFEGNYGQENLAEWPRSISSTSDGGYIITGLFGGLGFGEEDILLMKIDNRGKMLWQHSFGMPNINESARKVTETTDGSYLVLGQGQSPSSNSSDMYLLKTDKEGTKIWEKYYGTAQLGESGNDMLKVDDGYLLLGTAVKQDTFDNDFFIVKSDINGNEIWKKYIGTSSDDYATKITQLKDGNYILAGYTFGNGADFTDMYLIKIDGHGSVLWETQIDGPEAGSESGDVINGIAPANDGGMIISGTKGYVFGTGYTGQAWMIKLSDSGTRQWDKSFGIIGSKDANGEGIIALPNSEGYILVGSMLNAEEDTDFFLAKTDVSGNVLWEKQISRGNSEVAYDIISNDGFLIFTGVTATLEEWYQVYLMSFKNEPL